ncbi:unnamed protein product [Rotaria sordida]|uniref:Protease Do-like PDZ domain-containing protein n=1 Tax=Rotaria sordida TaxID=392033 RepID=A0A818SRV3_9BILA|nr:unnamed protein product [Rotaria sordida]CAF1289164.1 unnamed protein product [Rotaria sordida]CAF3672790.1 unnamed protein product [Rotaria sordida]CAF3822169.1 unnamed protein product [Rotaria sordida]
MEDSVQLDDDPVPLTDNLFPSTKEQLDLGDRVEADQLQRQPPLLQKRQLSNTTVHSLLEAETDPDAIESLELVLNSVVKVFCTSTPCNFYLPWQMKRQVTTTSSGFIIKNRWILSNAHAVSNQSSTRIRKHGDAKKYPARILHIAHECDLVIMTVDDDKFWNKLEPLTFSNDIPRLQESITIVGYPVGGDNLSVTKGVVSRVVMSTYSHSLEFLLTIQIDAATNPGNSGGPAIQGKYVVGMSFQGQSQAQSIGYIVPVSVIKHVLDDIELHNRYTAFPIMGFQYQPMENTSYREYLKLNDDQHGILVTSVEQACVLNKVLKEDDVITAIDNVPIADDGTIYFRRGERLNFRYLEKLKFVDDTVTFKIIRQGKELILTSPLDNNPSLVPLHSHDKNPEYLIYAGIVFTVLSRFYLYEWGRREWRQKAPTNLINIALYGELQELNQQIVIINQILVDDVNHGIYSDFGNSVLETVNGIKIKNIKHLAELIDKISNNEDNGYIRFEIENKKFIVISCKQAKQSEARILKQNSIAQPRSENLR